MARFLFPLLLLLSLTSSAQLKISVSTAGLFVNSKPVQAKFKVADAKKIFGEPDRIHVGDFWTYDKLGLVLLISKEAQIVTSISLYYPGAFEFDHNPAKTFKGKLTLAGYDVVANTTMNSLKSIPNVNFLYSDKQFGCGCDVQVGRFFVSVKYDPDCLKIQELHFLLHKSSLGLR